MTTYSDSSGAVQATPQSPITTTTSSSSPSVDHNRGKHPCVLCQQRKVKCDRNDPCANCTKARVQCVSSAMLPPKRRKKRFAEAELLARLRRYEEALRRYGADIDAINNDAKSTNSVTGAFVSTKVDLSPDISLPAPPRPRPEAIRSLAIRRSLKHVKNNLSLGMNEEFRDAEDIHILQCSSDDETLEAPIIKTYDAIVSDGSDFLLFSTPSSDSISDLHPSAVHIFRLWQSFIDNVNPLIKIFHAPTVQQHILEASADLENVSKEVEALMFGIYATAVTSLSEAECVAMFGEEKPVLLARYQSGARQALARAGLLRSSNITTLTSFILYLISCLNFYIDPRSHFCLSGIAIRIAQRMGLNYDGTTYGLPPFETEMRRRLWYQIMFLDNRVSELSGVGCSVLSYVWTTKPPLNVNDSDLYPDMKDPPLESKGITEMVYVLQRCEVANVMQQVRNCSASDTLEDKDRIIENLQQRLTQQYEKFCDPSVPLHLIATLMSRCATAKLSMGPRHPLTVRNSSSLPPAEKDKLFNISLRMMETHNAMVAAPSLKRFMWHVFTNFPFPAHVYLLCTLRVRTTGPLVDRAWQAFADHYRLRRAVGQLTKIAKHRDSALQLALANMTIKAWNAREKDNPTVEVPKFVLHLRCRLGGGKGMCPAPNTCYSSKEPPPIPEEAQQPVQVSQVQSQAVGVSPQVGAYQWLQNQPAMQFDMANMGMRFDDDVMQDLIPTFSGDILNDSFGIDLWSDYRPDASGMGVDSIGVTTNTPDVFSAAGNAKWT